MTMASAGSCECGPVGRRSRIDAVTSLKSSVCLTQTDVDVGVVGGAFGSEASSNVLFKLTCFLEPLKCAAVGLVSVLRDDKETHGAEPPICLGMGLFSMQSLALFPPLAKDWQLRLSVPNPPWSRPWPC